LIGSNCRVVRATLGYILLRIFKRRPLKGGGLPAITLHVGAIDFA
jgi:hypothetical protein